jgi:hypothetical protein
MISITVVACSPPDQLRAREQRQNDRFLMHFSTTTAVFFSPLLLSRPLVFPLGFSLFTLQHLWCDLVVLLYILFILDPSVLHWRPLSAAAAAAAADGRTGRRYRLTERTAVVEPGKEGRYMHRQHVCDIHPPASHLLLAWQSFGLLSLSLSLSQLLYYCSIQPVRPSVLWSSGSVRCNGCRWRRRQDRRTDGRTPVNLTRIEEEGPAAAYLQAAPAAAAA